MRDEMYRIRRTFDGWYLFKDFTVVKNIVYLRWPETMPARLPSRRRPATVGLIGRMW